MCLSQFENSGTERKMKTFICSWYVGMSEYGKKKVEIKCKLKMLKKRGRQKDA